MLPQRICRGDMRLNRNDCSFECEIAHCTKNYECNCPETLVTVRLVYLTQFIPLITRDPGYKFHIHIYETKKLSVEKN